MIPVTYRRNRLFPWGLTAILLSAAGTAMYAQTPSKSAAKSPAKSSVQQQEDPLAPLLQTALDAINKNDFAAALDPLQKYIAQRPDDPFAHFQLGYSYSALKRWEDAKGEFSRAIALDPKMAPAYINLGLVLMDNDPGAAAEAFLHGAELQPAESRPRFLAGSALERAEKFTDAIEQYRSALTLSPKDFEYHFALGRVLLRAGSPGEAEGQFQEAIVARGDSAPARLGLANALLAEKKYDAGADALAEYLKLNPTDRAARLDRASALLEIERYDDALAELGRADEGSTPVTESLKMRGDIYLHQKKWKEASGALTQAVSQSPQDPDLLTWLGHVRMEMHDYPTASKLLTQAHTINPNSADVLRDLASALFLNDDYASALDTMDRLARLETPLPASWFIRGICYDKLSDEVEALAAYQKFLDLDNGKNDSQDIEARHRILALQKDLREHPPKKQKN